MFGDKTSTLDKIGIRRLMAYIKSQVKLMSKQHIFAMPDHIIRSRIHASATKLMDVLHARQALPVVDAAQINMDIFVKPTKAADFFAIKINMFGDGNLLSALIDLEVMPYVFEGSTTQYADGFHVRGVVGLDDMFVCDPSTPGVNAYFVVTSALNYILYSGSGDQYFIVHTDKAAAPHYTSYNRDEIEIAINGYVIAEAVA